MVLHGTLSDSEPLSVAQEDNQRTIKGSNFSKSVMDVSHKAQVFY